MSRRDRSNKRSGARSPGEADPMISGDGNTASARVVVPPPAPSMTRVRQTFRFARDPLALLREALHRHGDVFRLHLLGLGEWVFLCSPHAVAQMFAAPRGTLGVRTIHRRMLTHILGDDAVFNLDGELHRRRQRLIVRAFTGQALTRHVDVVRSEFLDLAAKSQEGPVSLMKLSHALTLQTLLRHTMGATPLGGQRSQGYTRLAQRAPPRARRRRCEANSARCLRACRSETYRTLPERSAPPASTSAIPGRAQPPSRRASWSS